MLPKIDAEKFVRVWQASDTGKEVAEQLGIKYSQALGFAGHLRKKGVPLKMMSGRRPYSYDYAKLAKIAEEASK